MKKHIIYRNDSFDRLNKVHPLEPPPILYPKINKKEIEKRKKNS